MTGEKAICSPRELSEVRERAPDTEQPTQVPNCDGKKARDGEQGLVTSNGDDTMNPSGDFFSYGDFELRKQASSESSDDSEAWRIAAREAMKASHEAARAAGTPLVREVRKGVVLDGRKSEAREERKPEVATRITRRRGTKSDAMRFPIALKPFQATDRRKSSSLPLRSVTIPSTPTVPAPATKSNISTAPLSHTKDDSDLAASNILPVSAQTEPSSALTVPPADKFCNSGDENTAMENDQDINGTEIVGVRKARRDDDKPEQEFENINMMELYRRAPELSEKARRRDIRRRWKEDDICAFNGGKMREWKNRGGQLGNPLSWSQEQVHGSQAVGWKPPMTVQARRTVSRSTEIKYQHNRGRMGSPNRYISPSAAAPGHYTPLAVIAPLPVVDQVVHIVNLVPRVVNRVIRAVIKVLLPVIEVQVFIT